MHLGRSKIGRQDDGSSPWRSCRIGRQEDRWNEGLQACFRMRAARWPSKVARRAISPSIQCCTLPPLGSQNGNTFPEKLTQSERPPRPKRIILVRHGESEGNVDECAYVKIPDNKISLTEKGWKQAILCGQNIRKLIESDGVENWQVYFYVSPYKRSLQSLRGIGMAFERERIAGVREEPRLREQDFGNFQDREKMRVDKEKRLRFGRFFYRFPDGESAADVYDRITGFRETLRADIDIGRFQRPESRSKDVNLVIVSHGLTLRVFLARWYKWTVKQFEGLGNFSNSGLLVMQLGTGGRYSLLIHHTHEELKAFGMTDEMILDQEWQTTAKVGELNYDWMTSGPNFFSHFDSDKEELDREAIPSDIVGRAS